MPLVAPLPGREEPLEAQGTTSRFAQILKIVHVAARGGSCAYRASRFLAFGDLDGPRGIPPQAACRENCLVAMTPLPLQIR